MATALSIIEKTLRILRVLDRNQLLQADDRNDALEALNQTTNYIATKYNHLWLEDLCIVLCKSSQPSYDIGVGGQYVVRQADLKVVTVAVAALSGATTITLSSAAGIASGDKIAVLLDNQTSFFTAVNGAPVGNVVTLSDALTDSVASGNTVYSFKETAPRPLRIRNAQYADAFNNSEIPIQSFSRDTYFDQPVKLTSGSVSNWYYDPQLSTGKLYLWPVPYADKNVVRFTAQRPFNVAVNNIDSVDFPDEWHLCLAYMTAASMMDEYGLPADRQQAIQAKADDYLMNCLSFDNDASPVKIELSRF
jgi:hypothetical protein